MKISQRNFSVSIGMNYSTFRFWVCYGHLPDVETACDIARALGVTVEYLLKGVPQKLKDASGVNLPAPS